MTGSPKPEGRRTSTGERWWERAVIHVYPRSFVGSYGDGVGDLRGVTEGLPYLC